MSIEIPLLSEAQNLRRLRREESAHQHLWDILDGVVDPEIPVLSLWDLGVLQDIRIDEGLIVIEITPTYSGCPAMVEMSESIYRCLKEAGHDSVEVRTLLSPTWSTEFLTQEGREKMRRYGISPPRGRSGADEAQCPQCGSDNVARVSEFGSTACKALYRCLDCKEPFDHFKCI